MKKTLVALALASLPAAAMADVVLYGQIKGGVEVSKERSGVEDGVVYGKGTSTKIVDYGSRIGFKGHEHLNGNLKAIWQLEQRVNIAGGEGTRFGSRDSFIGLQGDFGTVKVGNLSTPLGNTSALNQWEYSSEAGGLETLERATKVNARKVAISYQSPEVAGFSGTVYYSPSENYNNEGTYRRRASNNDESVYGLSANYKNSGFFADVALGVAKQGTTVAAKSGHQVLVQGGYENDKLFAGLAFQQARNVENGVSQEDLDAGKVSLNQLFVGTMYQTRELAATVAYKAADALTVKGSAAYGFGAKVYDEATGQAVKLRDGKYKQIVLGADYDLSKRTQLNSKIGYLQFGKGANKAATSVVGVGLKHKF